MASFLNSPSGIPSHDTFNRVFAALDPVQFQSYFLAWMQTVAEERPAQVIAFDEKTVRRTHDGAKGRRLKADRDTDFLLQVLTSI